ncbi:MAG: hypothetical protein DMG13_08905 [Acidobacteria bacterium]|nr:MAG: hypothetical protein DMG13_08905 [Acidobacteriota bacterium]
MSITSVLLAITVMLTAVPAVAQDAGWIGVVVEDQGSPGAVIRRLDRNGPAERAGLKEGDVITGFNKQEVTGVLQFTRLVRETPPGRSVEVRVHRDNQDQTFQVTTMRAAGGRFWPLDIPDSTIFGDGIRDLQRIQITRSSSQSGIRVEQLTDQLRDFFGVYANEGVLVSSVDPGSAAGKAGIKAGDVITAVASKRVGTPAEFSREMRAAGPRPALRIIRDKQEREITIE